MVPYIVDRKHPFAQKVDESPDLRRHLAAGRPQHMKGAGALYIFLQHRAQAAVGNRLADSEVGQAGDTQALQGEADACFDVVADH